MTTTTCEHNNRFITGGIVRCGDCHEFFPEHPDSDPHPEVVEQNQWR